jgi:hypothetical protein
MKANHEVRNRLLVAIGESTSADNPYYDLLMDALSEIDRLGDDSDAVVCQCCEVCGDWMEKPIADAYNEEMGGLQRDVWVCSLCQGERMEDI